MSKEEQETNLPLHKQLQRSASLREKKDKLEERLRKQLRENPDDFFNAVYPLLKITAAENLLNEVQNKDLRWKYKNDRDKTFQILRALLNHPKFGSLLIEASTKKINAPTKNWMQHPPLDRYLERMKLQKPKFFEDYDDGTSLMQLLSFLRNHHQHTLQADAQFREDILQTKRISHAHYCKFFDGKFPELMAFLAWLYVGACDDEDEITKQLGSNGEYNLDLLNEEDFYEFMVTLMNFFFGNPEPRTDGGWSEQRKTKPQYGKAQLKKIIGEVVIFDEIGNFKGVTMKDPRENKQEKRRSIP